MKFKAKYFITKHGLNIKTTKKYASGLPKSVNVCALYNAVLVYTFNYSLQKEAII